MQLGELNLSFLFSFFFLPWALLVLLIWRSGKLVIPIFPSFSLIPLANQWKKWRNILTKQCWKHFKALCIRKQNSQFKRWHCPLSILQIECSSVAEMCSEMLEVTFFRWVKPALAALINNCSEVTVIEERRYIWYQNHFLHFGSC